MGKKLIEEGVSFLPAEHRDPRAPITTGYFVAGVNPAICPICRKVIPNKGARVHLRKCLKGRDFQIIHGVIRVFK